MSKNKSIFRQSWAGTCIRTDAVKTPELLIGYFIGPFGAMLSSGIFTSFLQAYLGDVLGLNAGFLSVLQLVSTVLIVAAVFQRDYLDILWHADAELTQAVGCFHGS